MKLLVITLSVIPLVLFPYTNGKRVASVEILPERFPDIVVSYKDCSNYSGGDTLDIKKEGEYTVVNYGFIRPTIGRAKFIKCS